MIVNFYQLSRRPAEAVLPPLVTKALEAGHRVVVRSADAGQLAAIDVALWRVPADSFLPHGLDSDIGPGRAASQPVLLTAAPLPAANGADCLVQLGGDLPDDLAGLARAMYLFDDAAIEAARARWRQLAKAPGVTPAYWREGEGGRFEKAG